MIKTLPPFKALTIVESSLSPAFLAFVRNEMYPTYVDEEYGENIFLLGPFYDQTLPEILLDEANEINRLMGEIGAEHFHIVKVGGEIK